MVRVYPQEAGKPEQPGMRREEGRAEVRRRMGPVILALGSFEGRRGLGGPCPFSRPERLEAPLAARGAAGWQGESGLVVGGSPIPEVAAPGPLGGAPWGLT